MDSTMHPFLCYCESATGIILLLAEEQNDSVLKHFAVSEEATSSPGKLLTASTTPNLPCIARVGVHSGQCLLQIHQQL